VKRLQIIFLLVALLGCSSNQNISQTTIPNILSTSSLLPTQTHISPTHTLFPTSISSPTLIPLPTWTPLPTIEPNKGLQTLYEWLEGKDDCRLPCWAGMTPGKTYWEDAKQLLESTSGFLHLRTYLDESCTFGKCNEITWSLDPMIDPRGYVYSILPENTIHAIIWETADPRFLSAFSLPKVLSNYGKPSILLFSTEPDLPGYNALELILVYPERQFLVRYSKFAEITSEKVESCGQDNVVELVILDNREQLTSLDMIAQAAETRDFNVNVWHKSVEEATGMTIDEFHEIYSKTNAPCISTPVDIWTP
jgi:hypothetical protein